MRWADISKTRYGYPQIAGVADAQQWRAGEPQRLYRVYREAGLCLRRKKRKHCARIGSPLRQYTAASQECVVDFAHDVVAAGCTIRVLSIIAAYTGSAWRWRSIPALPAAE
jgi:putative transposase